MEGWENNAVGRWGLYLDGKVGDVFVGKGGTDTPVVSLGKVN